MLKNVFIYLPQSNGSMYGITYCNSSCGTLSLLWSQQNISMCPRLKSVYYACSLMSFFLPCLHSFCITLSVAENFSFSTSNYFRWNCENTTIIYDKLIEANNIILRNIHAYCLNRLPLKFKWWYLYYFVTSPLLLIKILHIRKIKASWLGLY